jgi:uncharacterized protein (DUF2147 family)
MLAILALLLQPGAPSPIEGRWTNPSNSVTIEISPCGTAWCGTVVAASDQAKADAARGGTKQLVGAQLLSGFAMRGKGWRGKLFVPDMNKRFSAQLQLIGQNSLKVRGCAVGGAICKSQLWSRVS